MMAQYDLYTLKNRAVDFVLDVQTDMLSHTKTRAIVPLFKQDLYPGEVNTRLNPSFEINGCGYLLIPQHIAVIPVSDIQVVGLDLKEYSFQITQALDFLFHGF